ncbi:MAG: hypothetical protein WC856_26735 [Methylococcaceae bacterium]
MYHDHNPPHFHMEYQGHQALMARCRQEHYPPKRLNDYANGRKNINKNY